MHLVLSYLYHQGVLHWPSIAAFLGSGAALSTVTQVTKRLKQWEKDATIQKFVIAIGLLGTITEWYLTNYSTHFAHAVTPFVWFPAVTGVLFTLATFFHKFPVSQIDSKLTNYFSPLLQAASELKAEVASSEAASEAATPEEPKTFTIQG
jgi:hypothetical protein